MSQIRLPAKVTNRLEMILTSATESMEQAKEDPWPEPCANGVMTCLMESLAQTMLTNGQQQQVKRILESWRTCRLSSRDLHRSAAEEIRVS